MFFLFLTVATLYAGRQEESHIEVTEETITKVYKNGRSFSLGWDEIEIETLKNEWGIWGVKLLSKLGKDPIVIEKRIRDYTTLISIIKDRTGSEQ